MKQYIVSVLAPDRVGLLCDTTQCVLNYHGNIGQIRQTIVDGYFSLIFVLEAPDDFTLEPFQDELKAIPDVTAITVSPYEPGDIRTQPTDTQCFVITLRGPDKPGTILGISSYLVAHKVNIEDWLVARENLLVTYTARINVPVSVELEALRAGLKEVAATLGHEAHLCHENIIRATNEIGPIKSLLG